MDPALTEWGALGRRLQQLCPEKFDEIVDCLRETVGAQEILAPVAWTFETFVQTAQIAGKA